MTVKFTNNVKTKVTVAALSDATTIVVDDVSRFPNLGPGEYTYCTLSDTAKPDQTEICEVTSINRGANELTVIRGKEGTAKDFWRAGSNCELRLTAELLTRAIQDKTQDWGDIEGVPNEFPPAPHTHDEYLTDAIIDGNQYARKNGAWSRIVFPDSRPDGPPSWDEVTDKPTEFPPADHTHPEFDELGNRIDAIEDSITEGGGFIDAPDDGKLYGRQSENWAEVVIPDSGDGKATVISDTAPEDAAEGDLWFCSLVGNEGLFCFSDDPNGGEGYWFEVGTTSSDGGGENASVDLSNYVQKPSSTDSWMVYKDGWTPVTTDLVLTNSDLAFRDAKGRFKSTKEVPELKNQLEVNRWFYEQLEAIPDGVDLTGYATETYVDDSIAAIPATDLTGYATETYVDDSIAAIEFPEIPEDIDLWKQNGNDIYYNAGNVGIGREPTDTLDISGGITVQQTANIKWQNTARNTTYGGIKGDASDLSLTWNGDKKVILSPEGKVGIGVDSPERVFHAKASQQVTGLFESTGNRSYLGFRDFNTGLAEYGPLIGSSGDDFTIATGASNTPRLTVDATGNVGIGMIPVTTTFDLSAKEQLKEWKTKAKKASWPIVTDGAFEQEPTEELVAEWIETRAAGDKLQVYGDISARGGATVRGGIYVQSNDGAGQVHSAVTLESTDSYRGTGVYFKNKDVDQEYFAGCSYKTGQNFIIGKSTVDGGSADRANAVLTIDPTGNATFSGKVNAGTVDAQYLNWSNVGAGLSWTVSGNEACLFPTNGASGGSNAHNIGSPTSTKFKNAYFSGTVSADGFACRAGKGGSGSANVFNIHFGLNGPDLWMDSTNVGTISTTKRVSQDFIRTLSTLRNATKDETTLEGMRDALSDAIGGLIEKFEHEIAAMPAPEAGE